MTAKRETVSREVRLERLQIREPEITARRSMPRAQEKCRRYTILPQDRHRDRRVVAKPVVQRDGDADPVERTPLAAVTERHTLEMAGQKLNVLFERVGRHRHPVLA